MLVSLMGSSILSEGCQHLDSQEGALQCYYDPLNRLAASRLLLPLSGLERSDFVLWPDSDMAQRPARVRYRHQTGSFACAVRSATNSCGFGLHVRGVDVLGRLARRGDLLAVPEHMKQFVNEL